MRRLNLAANAAGQSTLADYAAEPFAEREPAHASGADAAPSGGEAENLELVIYVPPGGSSSNPQGACGWIHVDALNEGEVDDHAVVKRDARKVVAGAMK